MNFIYFPRTTLFSFFYLNHICCAMKCLFWPRSVRKMDLKSPMNVRLKHRGSLVITDRGWIVSLFSTTQAYTAHTINCPLCFRGNFKKSWEEGWKKKKKSSQYREQRNAELKAWLCLMRFRPHMSLKTNWYVLAIRHGIWSLPSTCILQFIAFFCNLQFTTRGVFVPL